MKLYSLLAAAAIAVTSLTGCVTTVPSGPVYVTSRGYDYYPSPAVYQTYSYPYYYYPRSGGYYYFSNSGYYRPYYGPYYYYRNRQFYYNGYYQSNWSHRYYRYY